MKEFISDSGRFVCKKTFLERNPSETLLKHCTDVVHYSNGQYIQVLRSGLFYVDEKFSSRDLDECEQILMKKSQLLNES
jgi:hypothetical protein